MYAAVGCSLALPQLLETLPEGATSGVLLFVGLRGFMTGNEFWDRFLLLFASPSEFPADRPYSVVPCRYLHTYTLVQVLCFGYADNTFDLLHVVFALIAPIDCI